MACPFESTSMYKVTSYPSLRTISPGTSGYKPTPITLYEEGCWVNGVRDCTQLCTNSTLIWGATQEANLNVVANIHNCLEYMQLEALGVDSSTHDCLLDYGIRPVNQSLVSKFNESISGCLNSYCKNANGCIPNSSDRFNSPYTTVHVGDQPLTLPYPYSICLGVDYSVNPDIGGVGVLTAYMVAACLLVLIYSALRLSWSVARLSVAFYWIGGKSSLKTAWNKATRAQNSIQSSRHIANLVAILADFQKAQCIFWFSMSLAVTVVLVGPARSLGASNVGSFISTVAILQTICASAVLFVVFGMYCLHRAGKRSWYIFILSFFTAGYASVAWGFIQTASPSKLAPNNQISFTSTCGVYIPQTYCSDSRLPGDIDIGGLGTNFQKGANVAAYVILVSLFLDMIALDTPLKKYKAVSWWASEFPERRWVGHVRSTVRLFCEVWFVLFTASESQFLIPGSGISDWSFGQVIAITIWIPIITEWLYATIRGLDNASEHRITFPYKMVRTDSQMQRGSQAEYASAKPMPSSQTHGNDMAMEDFSYMGLDSRSHETLQGQGDSYVSSYRNGASLLCPDPFRSTT